MSDTSYSLGELARSARISKARLLEMLRSGALAGRQLEHGRREWRIEHADAVAAGLHPVLDDDTIDAAVRRCVATELIQLSEQLEEHHRETIDAITAMQAQIEDLAPARSSLLERLRDVMVNFVGRSPNQRGVTQA